MTRAQVSFGAQRSGAGVRPCILVVVSSGFPQEDFEALSAAGLRAEPKVATDEIVHERSVAVDATIRFLRPLAGHEVRKRGNPDCAAGGLVTTL